jgi:hypothetical protein
VVISHDSFYIIEDQANRSSNALSSIHKAMEGLQAEGKLAPTGCSLVRYQARGQNKRYWYYKLQATEPIFPTKSGNLTRFNSYCQSVRVNISRTKNSLLINEKFTHGIFLTLTLFLLL